MDKRDFLKRNLLEFGVGRSEFKIAQVDQFPSLCFYSICFSNVKGITLSTPVLVQL
jgi:hypothetical protein